MSPRSGGSGRPGRGGGRRREREPAAAGEGESWVVGRNAVRELLERGREAGIEKILVDAELPRGVKGPILTAAREAGAVVQDAPRHRLDRLAEGAAHQGVAARVAPRPLLALDELLAGLSGRDEVLLVLLDRVEDPRNLGAIVRSAAAAGADGVLVPERRSAGLTPGAAKTAAGALERIPIARVGSVAQAVSRLQDAGLRCVGLDAEGRTAWSGPDLGGRLCLVVGAEDRGLSRLVRERCDELVSFPLAAGVESLNAAVAASLALYEAVRQREGDGSG